MWEWQERLYVVKPYHDRSYARDETAQEVMKDAVMWKERRVMIAFFGMFVSFGVLVLSGLTWFPIGLAVGATAFVGAFAFGLFMLLTLRPRLPCTNCGKRMQVDWGPIGEGRDGEYLICSACRSYVFTYRTSG